MYKKNILIRLLLICQFYSFKEKLRIIIPELSDITLLLLLLNFFICNEYTYNSKQTLHCLNNGTFKLNYIYFWICWLFKIPEIKLQLLSNSQI